VSEKTNKQYTAQAEITRQIFIDKNKDYGLSWRILRIPSLIDQIYIKADRIRNLENGKIPCIKDDISSEFAGIINYCIITLIQIELNNSADESEISFDRALTLYDLYLKKAQELMKLKNHDYGEAWRNMYISSYTDIILTKILRIRQILENKGQTWVSEGIESNLFDMINYAFFALIKIKEQDEN